jgi:hypothetical protein
MTSIVAYSLQRDVFTDSLPSNGYISQNIFCSRSHLSISDLNFLAVRPTTVQETKCRFKFVIYIKAWPAAEAYIDRCPMYARHCAVPIKCKCPHLDAAWVQVHSFEFTVQQMWRMLRKTNPLHSSMSNPNFQTHVWFCIEQFYVMSSVRAQNQAWLCWRGPARLC